MTLPPFFPGLVAIFWGWQTGLLPIGLLLGLALEAPRWVAVRFDVGLAEVTRLAKLSGLLLAGAALYAFAGTEAAGATAALFKHGYNPDGIEGYKKITRSVLVFLQWSPLALAPIALARAYSAKGAIDLMPVLNWAGSLRHEWLARSVADEIPVRSEAAFCVFMLVSASASEVAGPGFFIGLALLTAAGLWPLKRRRLSRAVWVGCVLAMIGLGYGGQVAALQIREVVQRFNQALAERLSRQRPDSDESHTAIGSIGSLKQSGRILLRIDSPEGPPPVLLRESSYNALSGSVWLRVGANLEAVYPVDDGTTWILRKGTARGRPISVSRTGGERRGMLAAPMGIRRLRDLRAGEVFTNRLGSIVARETPGFLRYSVDHDLEGGFDGAPDSNDLTVPLPEARFLQAAVREMGLSNQPPVEVIRRVESFFEKNFTYTLALGKEHVATRDRTALGRFLAETRSGHGEYFATATVLLLRQLGIPARYATGFAVSERKGKQYIARQRDAHAWCLVWVGGRWRELDTTPSSWHQMESSKAAPWEPIGDFFSSLFYQFSRWRTEGASIRPYLLAGSAVLLVILVVRLAWTSNWRRAGRGPAGMGRAGAVPGLDSEFLALVLQAERAGIGPQPGETAEAWVGRVRPYLSSPEGSLDAVVRLHQKHRFDPAGLAPGEREQLRRAALAVEVQAGNRR